MNLTFIVHMLGASDGWVAFPRMTSGTPVGWYLLCHQPLSQREKWSLIELVLLALGFELGFGVEPVFHFNAGV